MCTGPRSSSITSVYLESMVKLCHIEILLRRNNYVRHVGRTWYRSSADWWRHKSARWRHVEWNSSPASWVSAMMMLCGVQSMTGDARQRDDAMQSTSHHWWWHHAEFIPPLTLWICVVTSFVVQPVIDGMCQRCDAMLNPARDWRHESTLGRHAAFSPSLTSWVCVVKSYMTLSYGQ